jgi:hypothetical protein
MQWLINFLTWLDETPLALAVAQSEWLFPAIEVVHVFAISLVFGTIAIVDLRLLGLASTNRRYTEMARELLPLTWAPGLLPPRSAHCCLPAGRSRISAMPTSA